MNIHILAPDGKARVRPDTTLNRFKEDYYVPDSISEIEFTPVMFFHVSKAGKAVSPRFARRYYSAAGFGMMVFPDGEEFYDGTSLLSMVEIKESELENDENHLIVYCGDKKICDICIGNWTSIAEKAITSCSCHTSLRIGDFVAAEIGERGMLVEKPQADGKGTDEFPIKAIFGDTVLFDTKFIF